MNNPKETQSEFGQGLVYNLVLFANHFSNETATGLGEKNRAIEQIEKDEKKDWSKNTKYWLENMVPIYGNNKRKALSHEIEMWANGATDHLYEMEVPEDWDEGIGELVEELSSKGLRMGHGFTEAQWTMEDLNYLMKLTKKIARMIDEKLGVTSIEATWE